MKKSIYIFIILFLFILVPVVNSYQSISDAYSSIFSRFFSFITGRSVGTGGDGSYQSGGGVQNCDIDEDGYLAQTCGGNDCNDNNGAI